MATKTDQPLGIESQLWAAADKLRGSMDASEYKHVALGLLFLKYISDAFEELHSQLENEPGADPEDKDEYTAENVFWVPQSARWSRLRDNARQPTIGVTIDEAMGLIESDNPKLRGVLPRDFARESLDSIRLGELVDLFSNISVGDKESRSSDVLGRVYEYFLGQFASAEGKRGGEFYTPTSIVQLLVEMIEPYKGRVYDPCCGSGGMFVQSEKFIEQHDGTRTDISVFGQESNNTTWKLAMMNLAIRGIEANIGWNNEGSFHRDAHPDLKADYILANPPFNQSDWGGERVQDDVRWKYGTPPTGNANYGWIQHFIHHLSSNGVAAFVMANGSIAAGGAEGKIRQAIIEADLVDCIVALPGQLFYSTQIPVCLWFLRRNRSERSGETLFIDARELGRMTDRTHKIFDEEEIKKIAETYHAWKTPDDKEYEDIAGFCASAESDVIESHGHVLTPGRYVGIAEEKDDGEPFEEKLERISDELKRHLTRSQDMDESIHQVLNSLRQHN